MTAAEPQALSERVEGARLSNDDRHVLLLAIAAGYYDHTADVKVAAATEAIIAAKVSAALDVVQAMLDRPVTDISAWMQTNPHAWATSCVADAYIALTAAAPDPALTGGADGGEG